MDEDESFKKALGGGNYKTWWLLKPSVLLHAVNYVKRFGQSAGDVTDKKTQMMGGAFVVKSGNVVYTHRETSTFYNGDAKELLAACLGKDVSSLDALPSGTPSQADVVCTTSK